MTRDEILAANPIDVWLLKRGVQLKGSGNKRTTASCPYRQHKDGMPVTVDIQKQVYCCNADGKGGTIIDWLMAAEGISAAEAMQRLGGNGHSAPVKPPASSKPVRTYPYTDENGKELFQCVRFEPKGFRQRHQKEDGSWQWDLDGVRRVLYRLAKVVDAGEVIIVEGEKDVENLEKLGFIATCNPMGAGKWLDGYSESLAGKHVIVCGDNDEPGDKHAKAVIEAVLPKAKTVRRLSIPAPHKDASDWIASGATAEVVASEIAKLRVLKPGYGVPLKDMAQLEAEYREEVKATDSRCFSFGGWLPTLAEHIRPLPPGYLAVIIGDTASGKTLWLQNAARHTNGLPTIIFELELPGTTLFERFVMMDTGKTGAEVEGAYRAGQRLRWSDKLANMLVCDLSGLGVEQIQEIVVKSELVFGEKAALVMVDYIGLVRGPGKSRYERTSDVAESLKVLAKATNTVVIAASQRSRPQEEKIEVGVHDAKESGSIENSAQLVIGTWRDKDHHNQIHCKVLKSTRGGGGTKIIAQLLPNLEIVEQTEERE